MKKILLLILFTAASNIQSQWMQINTPTPLKSYIKLIKALDRNIFIITESTTNSVFFSPDEGNTWKQIEIGFQTNFINSLVFKNDYIFAACDSGICRSSNFGLNWEITNNGLPSDKYVYSLTLIDTTLYAVTAHQELYYSLNNGDNWIPTTFNSSAYCVESNGKDLFVGSHGLYIAPSNGIFVSHNYGITWSPINTGLPGYYIRSIAFLESKLFALVYSWIGETNSGPILNCEGVFISTNNGTSWEENNKGLIEPTIGPFLKVGENILTTTGSGGIYFYNFVSNNWDLITIKGLPYSSAYRITSNGTDLFVITQMNLLWKRPLSEIITGTEETLNPLPKYFSLSQNYPNPFNPTTTIKYTIPSVGTRHVVSVQLKVYDMLGREVATLVNEKKTPGNYEVTFNASNAELGRSMASGVYLYRLQAGSFSETKKFVLLK